MSPGRRTPAAGGNRWPADLAATLSLAWPLVLSNLAATALTTIDVILIGRLGADALAAAALGTILFHFALIPTIGLISAISPLIAAEYGRAQAETVEIGRIVRAGLWLAVLVSVPVCAALWESEAILRAFGQNAGLAAEAGRYLRSLEWALLPNLLFVVLRLFVASLGRPAWGLVVAVLWLPLNLGLAILFIFGGAGLPAFGLEGAGIATTLTAWAGVAALSIVAVTDRGFVPYRILSHLWRPDRMRLARIALLGLPIAATIAFEVAFFSGAGLVMGLIGDTELAAHAIALQIASLCFMVPLGVAQAATIRVGRALGAGDHDGVTLAGWAAFAVAMAFMVASAGTLLLLSEQLVGAFLDLDRPGNRDVAALAVQFLAFAAMFQLADGAQVVGAGMLRGLKDTRLPMLYAGLGYWAVGTPVGLLLAFEAGLRGRGVWIGLAVGLAAVSVLMLLRWTARERIGLVPRPVR